MQDIIASLKSGTIPAFEFNGREISRDIIKKHPKFEDLLSPFMNEIPSGEIRLEMRGGMIDCKIKVYYDPYSSMRTWAPPITVEELQEFAQVCKDLGEFTYDLGPWLE